ARANGVDIPDFDPAYFTRLWSAGRKATLIKKLAEAGVTKPLEVIDTLLASAVAKRDTSLTPAETAALGRVYNARIDEVSTRSALDRMRTMSALDSIDHVFAMLRDEAGMPEADARALATKLTGAPAGGARPNPTARRGWVLDDRHSITVSTAAGDISVSVADLLETDAGTVVNHYTRSLIAEGVMQSTLRTLSNRYGKSMSSVESLLREIEKEYRHEPGMTEAKRTRQIKRLSTGIALIKGLPTHENTAVTQTLQAIQKYNFVRSQGGFAVSAGFELMGMASRVSFAAMLRTTPIAREIMRQIKSGKVDGQVARAVLASMGTGYEGQIRAYLPELEARDPSQGGETLRGANRRLGQAQTAVSRLTMFEQINTFSQVWARTSYLQHLVDIAKRDQSLNAKRLAGLGLDEPSWKSIGADIRKNATPTQGAGGFLFDINLDGMDPVNRTRLLSAVDAKSRQLIQEGTIGGSDYWLETPGARVVTQFRQFMLQAHEKQLLANLQQFDGESAAYFLATLGLGSLHYSLISYIETRGAEDPEAELAKRLTPARIGYGAFTRAAFSGVAPTFVDTGLQVVGVQPLAGRRMTGAASYSLFDNPTFQLASQGGPSLVRLLRAGVDPTYDVSEQDLKGARSMLPLNRMPPIVALSNSIIRSMDVPQRPQQDKTDLLKIADHLAGF
ncbi:MAG TPA: hypothetical protein VEB22_12860, partial [Phycisphaerales bacterium]|nr:hypothetical protein [Phycisphaerales bacterium]